MPLRGSIPGALTICNLRQPDVAPVVLGFNYEVHNAPTDNSTPMQPPLDSATPISFNAGSYLAISGH